MLTFHYIIELRKLLPMYIKFKVLIHISTPSDEASVTHINVECPPPLAEVTVVLTSD